MTDSADISRVEDYDIGFDLQIADIGHHQIMGNSAIRYLDGGISLRQPDRRRIQRGAGFASACSAGSYSRVTARDIRPFTFLDSRVPEIGTPFLRGRGDRRRGDRDIRQGEARRVGADGVWLRAGKGHEDNEPSAPVVRIATL